MPTTTTGLATSFITFSRPGASGAGATVTDRDGRIKWAGHNLLLASESFDSSSWTKITATITANAIAAPNGTLTADKFASTNTNTGEMYQNVSKEASAIPYTAGVFAKSGGFNWLQIAVYDGSATGSRFWFDLQNGAKGSTSAIGSGYTNTDYNIVSLGSGWYYCWVKATTNTGTLNRVLLYPTNADSASTAGNGTDGIHLWGAHLYRSDMQMQLNPAMPAGMQSYYPTTPRNLLGFTEDIANAAWTKFNVAAFGSGSVANAVLAPNGLQTADLIAENTVSGFHGVYTTFTGVANTPYVWSGYVKPAGRTIIQFAAQATATVYIVEFNLTGAGSATNRTGTGTATITALSDGWYRISATATATASGTGYWQINLCNAANTTSYTGDGASGIYLWGAQLSDSASLDTYVPVYGAAVTSAAYYAPRLDFDGATLSPKGLLVEEQRTNIFRYTEAFNVSLNWFVGTTSVTADQTASPDGTVDADLITATSGGSGSYVYQSPTVSTTTRYTTSVYAKAGTAGFLNITVYDGTDGNRYWFNLSTGAVGSTALVGAGLTSVTAGTPVPAANGFYRCDVTFTTKSLTTMSVFFAFTDADNSLNVTNGRTGFLWGAQLEAGSFATSYIPNINTVAGATRAADVASVSTGAFPYSDTAGTVVVNVDMVGTSASTANGFFNISDGTPTSLTGASWITAYGDTSVVYSGRRSNNTSATNISSSQSLALNTPFKVGLAYAVGGTDSMTVNGGTIASQSGVASAYTNSILRLGTFLPGGNPGNLNGHIRQITYLPRRISNAELQSRTA